jgi:hypothetical protein
MPNEPLQTYRAVDPVGYHFGSIATTASQPFVLAHFTSVNYTALNATNQLMTFNSLALDADRFVPWVARNFDNSGTTGSYYPVAVPNAYDRILIFPMYRLVRSSSVPDLVFGTASAYVPPFILPMGLTPQTRGFTDVNKMNPKLYRFPDDVPTDSGYERVSGSYNIRTHGLWIPLAPYATNSLTSNGTMAVATSTDPRSFGRNPVVGTGTAYHLPADLSISKATTSGLTLANAQHATGSANTMIGMGIEFQTQGCQEIVCSLGSLPTGITITDTGSAGIVRRVELFLMGVFLG